MPQVLNSVSGWDCPQTIRYTILTTRLCHPSTNAWFLRIQTIRLETHATKDSLPQLRDQGDSLLVGAALTASFPVISGLADHPILEKLEMPVSPLRLAVIKLHRLTPCLVLADADPLGVNQNVTFEEVGGLDDRESTVYAQMFPLNVSKISMR